MTNKIRGQLLVRGDPTPNRPGLPPGKKLVLVTGLLLVDDNFPIASESFAKVTGAFNGDAVVITSLLTEVEPVPEDYAGMRIDDLLRVSIWKL